MTDEVQVDYAVVHDEVVIECELELGADPVVSVEADAVAIGRQGRGGARVRALPGLQDARPWTIDAAFEERAKQLKKPGQHARRRGAESHERQRPIAEFKSVFSERMHAGANGQVPPLV